MREIKFRGKCLDNEEWIYGFYYKDILTNTPFCLEDCRIKEGIAVKGQIYECIKDTIGQFIVNEDGFDIFEGDVIEESCHGIVTRKFVAEDIRTFTRKYDTASHSVKWKVIGNVHENKELLESL